MNSRSVTIVRVFGGGEGQCRAGLLLVINAHLKARWFREIGFVLFVA